EIATTGGGARQVANLASPAGDQQRHRQAGGIGQLPGGQDTFRFCRPVYAAAGGGNRSERSSRSAGRRERAFPAAGGAAGQSGGSLPEDNGARSVAGRRA